MIVEYVVRMAGSAQEPHCGISISVKLADNKEELPRCFESSAEELTFAFEKGLQAAIKALFDKRYQGSLVESWGHMVVGGGKDISMCRIKIIALTGEQIFASDKYLDRATLKALCELYSEDCGKKIKVLD